MDHGDEAAGPAAAACRRHRLAEVRPICLSIDLNEIPSPSSDTPSTPTSGSATAPTVGHLDAYKVALRFHANPPVSQGPLAEFPGEAGEGRASACGVCGQPETKGDTVVCDHCDKGFHLGCAKIKSRQALSLDDWICSDCKRRRQDSKGWPIGMASATGQRGRVRLLDINEPPPSDGDGDGDPGWPREAPPNCTSTFEDNNRDSCNGFHGGISHFHRESIGNGSDTENGINIFTDDPELGVAYNGLTDKRACDNGVRDFSPRAKLGGNKIAVRQSTRLKGEVFLQSLKEFIAERHGFLGEGWQVEFKQWPRKSDLHAIFCSPDGSRFDSMIDVARHLGLLSKATSTDVEEKPKRGRIKNRARLSKTSNSEMQEVTRNRHGRDSSDDDTSEPIQCNATQKETASESIPPHQLNIGLPVQFGDFYITSLGKVDRRRAYHDNQHIWPVGYTCRWHDKITGSVFESKVADGGDSGPIFKIKRSPCSLLPFANGKTILSPSGLLHFEEDQPSNDFADDDMIHIQMLAAEPDLAEHDLTSFFSNASEKCPNTVPSLADSSEDVLRNKMGEFRVQGRSSSVVWRMASQRLVNSCREAFSHSGNLLLGCSHTVDGGNEQILKKFEPLARFCCDFGPLNIPKPISCESELEASCKSLIAWLEQDRLGLDMDFVQEIIERLPGALRCRRYKPLTKRSNYSTSKTVGRGFLTAIVHGVEQHAEVDILSSLYGEPETSTVQEPVGDDCSVMYVPPGRPLNSRFPVELLGDVIQIWEFLWRFSGILGLGEEKSLEELEDELIDPWPIGSDLFKTLEKENRETLESSYHHGADVAVHGQSTSMFVQIETGSMREASLSKMASHTYARCTGTFLAKVHQSLLKILVGEMLPKVAVFGDPSFDPGELKSRRGRKRDTDISLQTMKTGTVDILPVNPLSWPELARRYILAVLSMDRSLESSELSSRDGLKIFRCMHGDGGILCGSLTGVAGMEADALLLAEAYKHISDPMKRENEDQPSEEKDLVVVSPAKETPVNDGAEIPDWAQPLEPVRKLPTNVGTRIRKCVYDSLEMNPPDWARKILEHSISKEVYKGNASGPTKKAVISVLDAVSGGNPPSSKPAKRRKIKQNEPKSDVIMKQCRIVLRKAVSADEDKVFCNLLGWSMSNPNDNDEEGILGFPGMVSRPLDFRTIDLRLAVGAYGGSHGAFAEDVREVWRNIFVAYGDRPDLMELAENLSKNFESLYEKEVLSRLKNLSNEVSNEASGNRNELPRAPWEEGVCKVCGIDKDDDSVLLCDTCDSEYHTYCLTPPLSKIPEGNWYCPSCVSSPSAPPPSSGSREHHVFQEALSQLAVSMEKHEYWELTVEERTFLLKFLCDEVLGSALIREHLDQCVDMTTDLQQKIRSVVLEWNSLKLKEHLLTSVETPEKVNPPSEDEKMPDVENHESTAAGSGDMEGLDSLKDKLSHVEESYADLESQLLASSLRRELLGRDSMGRMYWSIVRPRRRPWLLIQEDQFFICSSDEEINGLADSLKDDDPRERELKEAILQWHRLAAHQLAAQRPPPRGSDSTVPPQLLTRAAILLENKYGPFVDPEGSDGPRKRPRKPKNSEERMLRRCACLEPVWPARHHEEQQCAKNSTRNRSIIIRSCSLEEEEIMRRFTPKGSIKDLVQEIGLIGPNEIIPSLSGPLGPHSFPPLSLHLLSPPGSLVPESSTRPIRGKASQILKQLKMNLLDMDAALPEEALKPLLPGSRGAWRSLLKSADSIYQMVQAAVLLEGMVKTEYLKSGWWYWSSLTAAAKTTTLASLALRVYALDAAIVYSRGGADSGAVENGKTPSRPGRKRKDVDGPA